MSKQVVVGRQYVLQFNLGNGLSEYFEIERFSWKDDDMVKKNSSLGKKAIESLDVLDGGGTCSFETKMRDSRINTFFSAQKRQIRGDEATVGVRGRVPYAQVFRVTNYTDGTSETMQFRNLVLHNPEESADGNDEDVTQRFEGTYMDREIIEWTGSGDAGGETGGKGIPSDIIAGVNAINSNSPGESEAITTVSKFIP